MPLESLLLDAQKATILAVDDTPAILQLLEVALGMDYEVVTVESGREAIERFPKSQFDLVMLDLMMPEMDGLETLKALKALPGFAATPVIFLTAMDDLASECSALELGADDYITKPFKPNLVRLRIANILQRVRLQRLLSLALAGAEQGLWTWHTASGEVRVSAAWSEALSSDGISRLSRFIGWATVCHADDVKRVTEATENYRSGRHAAFEVDMRLPRLDGGWAWFNVYGKAGGDGLVIGTYRNVDQRKQAEMRLLESEERLRQVMDATGEGIWDWAVDEPEMRHNAAWCRLLGLPGSTCSRPLADLWSRIHDEDRGEVERRWQACLVGDQAFAMEFRIRHEAGWHLWVQARGRVVQRAADGRAVRMVGSLQDITEMKRIEDEYRQMALFDTLTGLPNRRLLSDRLTLAVEQNRRQGSLGALLFIDLDRFKELNDTLGHDHGDMLLIEVGQRLTHAVRRVDTVARLGGDEFVVMLPQLASDPQAALADARSVADKVLHSLGEPYHLAGHVHHNTPSIGLTLFAGQASEEIDQILRRADAAMYAAKRAGRNRVCVDRDDLNGTGPSLT